MKYIKLFLLTFLPLLSSVVVTAKTPIPAPIYADPYYTGSCDPEVVWNPLTKDWWIFYTGRRPALGIAATCGNPIGVARSKDLLNWKFEGYCKFDGVGGKPDSDQTFWAPGIVVAGDEIHMFVTYKPDATPPWGTGGSIAHYKTTLDDMVDGWTKVDIAIDEDNCLDACVLKIANGRYRMYYVGGLTGTKKNIKYAESSDLNHWEIMGEVRGDVNNTAANRNNRTHKYGYQEAVYVFVWKGKYFMITDPHDGLCTYVSEDGVDWRYMGQIMGNGTSARTLDWSEARHPSVAVKNTRAFIIYHVEPFRPEGVAAPELEPYQRYAFIQMDQLGFKNDKLDRKQ